MTDNVIHLPLRWQPNTVAIFPSGEMGGSWAVIHIRSNDRISEVGVYLGLGEATEAAASYARAVGAKFVGGES